MWSNIVKKIYGPGNVPHNIHKLVRLRFIFATLLGSIVDCQMLGIFLGFQLFEVSRPLTSLSIIFQWTMYSGYTTTMMILIRAAVIGYGLIMCHQHYAYPRCYDTKWKTLNNEFPKHILLLISILSVSMVSSVLYASFVDSNERDYHLLLGCLSGIWYYKTQYGCTLERFPVPLLYEKFHKAILAIWWPLMRTSGKEAFLPTIIFSMLFWSFRDNIHDGLKLVITEPEILFRGWLINTLIQAKLHMVRELYVLILQSELPLSVALSCEAENLDIGLYNRIAKLSKDLFSSQDCIVLAAVKNKPHSILSVPISMALDGSQLYGFRLLAAYNFHYGIFKSGSMLTELLDIKGMKNTNVYWDELREVIYKIIQDFLDQIDSCLDTAPRAAICDSLKREQGIRSLSRPFPKRRQKQCWGSHTCKCQSLKIHFCNMRNNMNDRVHLYWGHWVQRYPLILNSCEYLFKADKTARLKQALQCGEPLRWILYGLVRICVRSLKEDRFGVLQKDLAGVFEVLLKVEGRLIAAAKVLYYAARLDERCTSHNILMLANDYCLNTMLTTFAEHLGYIVNDQTLRDKLEHRIEHMYDYNDLF